MPNTFFPDSSKFGDFTVPDVQAFKDYFTRDFPYGNKPENVRDQDIQTGLDDAAVNFNAGLCANQGEFSIFYLLLAAHYMCTNIAAFQQGAASQYSWLQQSKSVGGVSASYAIPERILSNPTFAMIAQTRYGAKYLSFIVPRMVGVVFTSRGHTKP